VYLFISLPVRILYVYSRNCFHNIVVFTKNNQFIVAAIRKSIYVWDAQTGRFVKTLDAHFGRILSLVVVEVGDKANRVVSSSIDRSIKVSLLSRSDVTLFTFWKRYVAYFDFVLKWQSYSECFSRCSYLLCQCKLTLISFTRYKLPNCLIQAAPYHNMGS